MNDAVSAATAQGAIVIVAAGNEGVDADAYTRISVCVYPFIPCRDNNNSALRRCRTYRIIHRI